jgi:hypothetical protein
MLVTWDATQNKYRAWRFETFPLDKNMEAEFRLDGPEMVTKWVDDNADGTKTIARNRYKCVSKNKLVITSTAQTGNQPEERLGTLAGTRRK